MFSEDLNWTCSTCRIDKYPSLPYSSNVKKRGKGQLKKKEEKLKEK